MKKIILMLVCILGSMTASAVKHYDIIGVYQDAEDEIPATWRVVTTDKEIGVHQMTLKPVQIREKIYEVKVTHVAENFYIIEDKTFDTPIYIEVKDYSKKTKKKKVLVAIENSNDEVKGKLIL